MYGVQHGKNVGGVQHGETQQQLRDNTRGGFALATEVSLLYRARIAFIKEFTPVKDPLSAMNAV